MSKYYIRARSLTGLREVSKGDLDIIFQKFGLDLELLSQPDAPIEFSKYCHLLESCAQTWNLPDLGFRMAPYQHLEILGPVALVTRMEKTLGDAIHAITRNLVLYTNVLTATLEYRDDMAGAVLADHAPEMPIRQYMFLSLAVTKNVVEQTAGHQVPFVEASFREGREDSAQSAEAWFGCPVRFGSDRDALYFDRALLNTPLERSDLAYHAIIRRYLATERELIYGALADAVRAEIARQMELGACTLDSTARALRLEPRGLQRRLTSEGTSFRDLID